MVIDRFHNRMFTNKFNCDKLFLHAKQIEFIHPFTEEKINIIANFPSHWHKIVGEFDWDI